ncbi:SDR family oxidoreductase [Pseudomaricurvus alkylphenolicus]|jgi:NAD(P)-dependent dehydrogenase (short-subunit alcohol dehydrogenase family)|uniref:SDR family NAD(P)-dependent oxidoreductase n=1 Tax=Pseudomaricurvus alkylphenolicus TaxID=1306991 RepID=UPI00141DA349|nr:SDR family oxidoreductase [Pseudomaricurvus alkylphenolicus]NIB38882.1 SDR family oxidoreductase [Pseudomaricurvus alkylphenolicus]
MSHELNFETGVVLVAGGSGGIGSDICRTFARAGIPVVFTYYSNETKAQTLCDEIRNEGGACDYRRVDLSSPQAVTSLFQQVREQFGPIRHAVYASGPHFDFNFIGQIPNQDWQQVVNTDVNGAFYFIQSAVDAFKTNTDGGNLIAVITAAVERVPVKDIMSAAPKAAIEMLVRGVAKESGRFGIRANCVGPGWINAGLGKQGLEEKLDEKTRDHIRKTTIPLQSFGEGEDIANAALFLCSRQAKYITGQSLAVDGGLQL